MVCDELMTPFRREVARHHHPHARPAFALSWDMTPLFSRERRSFHRKIHEAMAAMSPPAQLL
jgi:hypothetical protein